MAAGKHRHRDAEKREEIAHQSLSVRLLDGGAAFGRQAALQNGRNEPSTHTRRGRERASHGSHYRSNYTGDKSSFYCLNARQRVKGKSI